MFGAGRWIACGVLAASIAACSSPQATPTPSPARPDQSPTTLSQLPTSQRVVALMFDLGDDAGRPAEILEVLRREGARATFSVEGYWAEQHRDLLLAMAADGHQIVNGTYDGTSFTGASTQARPLTAAERTLELSRTEVTVYHLTQRSTRPYWRPPYGDVDAGAQQDAANAGYAITVMPAFDTAASSTLSAAATVARTLAAAEPGAIFLMHGASASRDSEALPEIIRGLRAAGYGFTTIDEAVAP